MSFLRRFKLSPPPGVARQQAQKTVTQAVGNDRKTGDDGKRAAILPHAARPPGSYNVNASLQPEFMGRSRNVLDSITAPSNRGARAVTGHGAPLGIPRWQRAVSASGAAPSGARPARGHGRAFRGPFNPPAFMPKDTVKKASGYNPRMHEPAHFGAKAAVVRAQRPHHSIYASPLGQQSPSFVRSSDGFRPPATSEAQANVQPPQNPMAGTAMSLVGPSERGRRKSFGDKLPFTPPAARRR